MKKSLKEEAKCGVNKGIQYLQWKEGAGHQSESQTRGHFPTAATRLRWLQVVFPDTLTLFITVRLLAIAGVPAYRSLAEPHDALVTLAYTRQAYVSYVTHSC